MHAVVRLGVEHHRVRTVRRQSRLETDLRRQTHLSQTWNQRETPLYLAAGKSVLAVPGSLLPILIRRGRYVAESNQEARWVLSLLIDDQPVRALRTRPQASSQQHPVFQSFETETSFSCAPSATSTGTVRRRLCHETPPLLRLEFQTSGEAGAKRRISQVSQQRQHSQEKPQVPSSTF